MIIAKVVGTVISTRKNQNLIGNKFLIVEPVSEMNYDNKNRIVAIDNVGAGVGEIVLVTFGSSARIGCGMADSPVDAAIVGIVDSIKDVIIED
ncbi:Ethanolamine utilization protein EutN/carboxysome structural protein Ccml [Thermoanaerobacterium xylanolyticum LX-11]|uniref:Ethanolamine utilization protein EutN/carboxysome structural protein Ccml n=1 Tax=Thermoanaerobacterium xylanolyticum (strain ATCC 49914 / DSM 7097 / LX-11) TaxID=858215 RepID=F6BKF1_THEXL|nr:EutN/CcmL family microcompartment protein [Thermoanaerobacterium xylanolyticum]AEF18098.1 Ethanolamine utilization protein EutN/carboxysome structural protein Ccml [Thermoanaerobacterium xylanolyticum LX-11]